MNTGLKPTPLDARDYDFVKSHKLGGRIPQFPTEYFVDAGLWMPDQNRPESIFNNPAFPEGCTDYTQNDLCADLDKKLYNPAYTESHTHANAQGGTDLRTSLESIRKDGVQDKLGKVTKGKGPYFNVRAYTPLDYFDALRLAMFSGFPEKRSVSIGTPWFPEFEYPSSGILPVPVSFNLVHASWHNWKICGWKEIGGTTYLIGKSWQGENYGDNGFHYVSRELINRLMKITGTVAYTLTETPEEIHTIDITLLEKLRYFFYTLVGFQY